MEPLTLVDFLLSLTALVGPRLPLTGAVSGVPVMAGL